MLLRYAGRDHTTAEPRRLLSAYAMPGTDLALSVVLMGVGPCPGSQACTASIIHDTRCPVSLRAALASRMLLPDVWNQAVATSLSLPVSGTELAIPSTDRAAMAHFCLPHYRPTVHRLRYSPLSAYALSMRCPVLTSCRLLPASALVCTDITTQVPVLSVWSYRRDR
eukprot:3941737-Rhodomonas_salina.7